MTLSQSYEPEVLLGLGPIRGHRIFDNTAIRFVNPHLSASQQRRRLPRQSIFKHTEPMGFLCSVPKAVLFGNSSWALEAKIV